MTKITFRLVENSLKKANIRLRRLAQNKGPQTRTLVAETRLFLISLNKLLRYFVNVYPDQSFGSIAVRTFTLKYWQEAGRENPRILKNILSLKRYENLGRLYQTLEKLNKKGTNLTDLEEKVYWLVLLVFLIEVYTVMMFVATYYLNPLAVNTPAIRQSAGFIIRFRSVMSEPAALAEEVLANKSDAVTEAKIDKALAALSASLPLRFKTLIKYNKKIDLKKIKKA